MTQHFNRSHRTAVRRALRRQSTDAERLLWYRLRNKQRGVKFRRQYSVDQFVLDFYAPSCRLAIEVDGAQHFTDSGHESDVQRRAHLQRFGITVLRFSNSQGLRSITDVLEQITAAIRRTTSP